VSVRLAVVGGREVRAELEGVGEAGNRGFGRLGREMEAANARMAAFSRRVTIAMAAAARMERIRVISKSPLGSVFLVVRLALCT
jgi:hypothetical protein